MAIKINKNIVIEDTNVALKDIVVPKNGIYLDGFHINKLGNARDGRPIYLATADLGYLPNANTKTFNFALPSLYGILDANFIAYEGNSKIKLPYIYPQSGTYNYWITLDTLTNTSITIITGTNRSSYMLWGCFIYEATEELY